MSRVDPMDPSCHGKPLWVVYGETCHPQIICAKLLAYSPVSLGLLPVGRPSTNVCIWGYSVWKRKPGFRTIGDRVEKWAKRVGSMAPKFYDDQEEAIGEIRRLTTPKAGAL